MIVIPYEIQSEILKHTNLVIAFYACNARIFRYFYNPRVHTVEWAVKHKHYKLMMFLFKIKNTIYGNSFIYACRFNNTALLNILKIKKLKPDIKSYKTAAYCGNIDVLKWLINNFGQEDYIEFGVKGHQKNVLDFYMTKYRTKKEQEFVLGICIKNCFIPGISLLRYQYNNKMSSFILCALYNKQIASKYIIEAINILSKVGFKLDLMFMVMAADIRSSDFVYKITNTKNLNYLNSTYLKIF